MRPVVFLDVDGVLNAVPLDGVAPKTFTDWQTSRRNGFRIIHSPEMGARLAALEADIYWLTTWCELANEHIGPLFGWGELPVLGQAQWRNDRGPGWWKSKAAEQFVAEHHRPYVWIDDDLGSATRNGECGWLISDETPRLLVSPSTGTGLRPDQLAAIETFVAENAPIVEDQPE